MNEDDIQVVTNRMPELHESRDMKFALAICKHVKLNTFVLVKNGRQSGIGAGQMSRVESVEIASKKASDKVNGAVCASPDAFFPFKDQSITRLHMVSPLLFNRVVPSETRCH